MVCRFGMSGRLGPLTFGRPAGARFLDAPVTLGEERNFSEETARAIDAEVRAIIEAQHARAQRILRDRRAVLDRIAERLLERETLERDELGAIVDGARREGPVGMASSGDTSRVVPAAR